MLAMGITLATRYGIDPPPDVGTLGVVPMVGGTLFMLWGAALAAGGIAVLGNVRRRAADRRASWPRSPPPSPPPAR